MDIKITKGLPHFSEINKDRKVVFVEFPNCISTTTGQSFKWLPTYPQMDQIKKALDEIEVESWGKKGLAEIGKREIRENGV